MAPRRPGLAPTCSLIVFCSLVLLSCCPTLGHFMVGHSRAMIIKLRDSHQHTAAAVSTGSRHAGTTVDAFRTPCEPAQDRQTIGVPGEEMKNDFKWLIDFDLRSVNLEDIDGDTEASDHSDILRKDVVNVEETRKSNQKRKYSRYIPYTYSELIRFCLTENRNSTVREIYNWISERFPRLKPTDIAWKNAIRHTLSVNPLFQKQKIHGKRHSWYLQPNYQKSPQSKTEMKMDFKNLGYANLKEKSILLNTMAESENSDREENPFEMNSKCWYTTEDTNMSESITGCTDSLKVESCEYFELEIPIISEITSENTNYTEPIEVRYLIDETAASIPVHIF